MQSYPNLRVTAPPCTEVFCTGVTILRQGGNAVDAAITTALCQGILSPAASGLGGGHFMVIRAPNGTTEVIDAREPAPAAATENMFQGLSPNMLTVNINMAQIFDICIQAHVCVHIHVTLPFPSLCLQLPVTLPVTSNQQRVASYGSPLLVQASLERSEPVPMAHVCRYNSCRSVYVLPT